eukprot:m.793412 g.793412  ORF g.793412 m.793412 type:complete len:348 (-) comp59230_c0_seq4:307-1350(-)
MVILTVKQPSQEDVEMLRAINVSVLTVREGLNYPSNCFVRLILRVWTSSHSHQVGHVGRDIPGNLEPLIASNIGIYRAKVRALQLIEYEAVMFFDWDVLFMVNVDHWFELSKTVAMMAKSGYKEPLNTGLLVVRPSLQSALDLCDIASTAAFNFADGWLDYGEIPDYSSTFGAPVSPATNWTFWGATVDQGLFYYYFDRYLRSARIHDRFSMDGKLAHFAGPTKPWMQTTFRTLRPELRLPALYWLRYDAIMKTRIESRDLKFSWQDQAEIVAGYDGTTAPSLTCANHLILPGLTDAGFFSCVPTPTSLLFSLYRHLPVRCRPLKLRDQRRELQLCLSARVLRIAWT